jgi:hypothetical protein
MLRSTGPGKVELRPVPPVNGVTTIRASLFNFDIEGDTPKPEHEKFLLDNVVPVLANPTTRVKMRGEASRTGNDSFNLGLSNRRINKVVAFLQRHGLKQNQFQREAAGTTDARLAGDAAGTEDEKFRAVLMTVTTDTRRLRPVRFDRPFHLGLNDGFDDFSNPPWVMVKFEEQFRQMQVENAEGLSLVSTNSRVAVPQPALFNEPGPVRITQSVQRFRIIGVLPGDAEIHAIDAQRRVVGRLRVSVLTRLNVTCAFHYVSNPKYGTRTRRRGDEAEFLRVLKDVWSRQSNIEFEQVSGNASAPPLVMTEDLGDVIDTQAKFDTVASARHRIRSAQFNVFFIREIDMTGRPGDNDDARTTLGEPGDCLFEDEAGGPGAQEVLLAHESGHCLTLPDEDPTHASAFMLMISIVAASARPTFRFLPRAHVLQARRGVRR